MDECLLFEVKNKIGILTFNRPSRHNAFDDSLIYDLNKLLIGISMDANVKVLLLTANGKNFSAGADIEWMKKIKNYSQEENIADAMQLANLLKTLANFSKPTIALVNGKVIGGGVGLLSCCDIVIAEEEAKFCFSEAKIGLIPATIAPYVIQAIGSRAAKYYFLTANFFNATEAYRVGLVHAIVKKKDLFVAGMETAHSLLMNSPLALAEIKNLVASISQIDAALSEDMAKLLAKIRISDEAQEGLSAFLEKRSPIWK